MTFTPGSEGYNCTLHISEQAGTRSSVKRNDTVFIEFADPVASSNGQTILSIRPDTLGAFIQAVVPHVVLASFTNSFDIALARSNDTLHTWDFNVADGFESWFVKQ